MNFVLNGRIVELDAATVSEFTAAANIEVIDLRAMWSASGRSSSSAGTPALGESTPIAARARTHPLAVDRASTADRMRPTTMYP
jgi:hypothetical protein